MNRPLILLGVAWLFFGAALLLWQRTSARVTISWETGSEQNTAGFNLYRSAHPQGPFVQLNQALIAAQGSAAAGAVYRFVDAAAPPQTHYYRLEEVELDGTTTQLTPAVQQRERPSPWLRALTAVSAITGCALLLTGVKNKTEEIHAAKPHPD